MNERLYLDRQDVYVLADYDESEHGGRAQLVVCEHPDGAGYAAHLAGLLGIPVQHGPGQDQQAGSGLPAARRSYGGTTAP